MKNIKINKNAFNLKKFAVCLTALSMIVLTSCKDEKKLKPKEVESNAIASYSCEEYIYEHGEWIYNGTFEYEKMPLYDGKCAYYIVAINYENGNSIEFDGVGTTRDQPNVKVLVKGN